MIYVRPAVLRERGGMSTPMREICFEHRPADRPSARGLFRSLVEQSLVGIHIIQDGKFAYVNPKLAEIFGYTGDELLALDSWLTLVADDDRDRVAAYVRQRHSGEAPSARYVLRGRRKDGTD